MFDKSESIAAAAIACATAIASFLFDESVGVVVACAAGAYFGAYKNKTDRLLHVIAMILAGIFLGTLSVKGVNYLLGLWQLPNPPRQVSGLIFSFLLIHKKSQEKLFAWFGARTDAAGSAFDSIIGGKK